MVNQEIHNRLNRIEGQIAGISKMVQVGDKNVLSIIQQIMAVKNALEKVGSLILFQEINKDNNQEKLQKVLDYLIKLS
jgi:DNA-binding FrmR family transcriptional regulator